MTADPLTPGRGTRLKGGAPIPPAPVWGDHRPVTPHPLGGRVVTPCPTCRHYVIHLHQLGATIATLRIGATRHRGLHGRLMEHVRIHRRIRVRLSEHRAAIHDLAAHLTTHAEEAAA